MPGGGITGILAPEGGGDRFIAGSISPGGLITPPERPRSELLVPLAGGSIGALGWPSFGRPLRCSADVPTATKDKSAAAMIDSLSIPAAAMLPSHANTVRLRQFGSDRDPTGS